MVGPFLWFVLGASLAVNITTYAVVRSVAGDLEASRHLDSAFLVSSPLIGLSAGGISLRWLIRHYWSDAFIRVTSFFAALSVVIVGTLVAFYWPWFFWTGR